MISFKLNADGSMANKVGTGEWHSVTDSSEYLAWVEEGNTAQIADSPSQQDIIQHVMLGMKSRRMDVFRVLDTLQVDALTEGDQTNAMAIMQAKSAMTALNNIDLSGYQTAEAMEQAIQFAYWGIVSQAPQEVQAAFNALVPR